MSEETEKPEDRKARRRQMVREFERFLMVGRFTHTEWESLSVEQKACAFHAQQRLNVAAALPFVEDEQAAVELLSTVDGGNAIVRKAIDDAVNRYAEKRSRPA
jgi:hypothetical protein